MASGEISAVNEELFAQRSGMTPAGAGHLHQDRRELTSFGAAEETESVEISHQEALSPDDVSVLRGLARTQFMGMRDEFGHPKTREGLRAQQIATEVQEREE